MLFKKIVLGMITFCALNLYAQKTNLSIDNGMVKFGSLAVYEQYAENTLNQDDIVDLTVNSNEIKTLANDSDFVEVDSLYDEFLLNILNTDKIFEMGSFMVKIDLENHQALAINAANANAYADLVANNTDAMGMMVFDDEVDNGIDILEQIESNVLTPQSYKTAIEENGIFGRCRHAKRGKDAGFQYWFSYPNNRCPGKDYCYRGEDKLVYQKAIFYFSIEAKRKNQKECCYDSRASHNPQRHFVNIKIEGRAKFEKRCKGEQNITISNEVFNDHKISRHPYQGSRSLSKYDVSVIFY